MLKLTYGQRTNTKPCPIIWVFVKVYLHRSSISRLDTHPQCSIMDKGYYGLYSLSPKESTISCSIYQSTSKYLEEKPNSLGSPLVKLLYRVQGSQHATKCKKCHSYSWTEGKSLHSPYLLKEWTDGQSVIMYGWKNKRGKTAIIQMSSFLNRFSHNS